MAQLIVRNLDDKVKERLRERAKRNGRSLEAEARTILEDTAVKEGMQKHLKKGLGTRIADRFKGIGFSRKEKRAFDRTIEQMWQNNPPRFVEFDK
jgi:plasmid stability protein